MRASSLVKALAAIRIGIGVTAWVAPRAAGRALALEVEDNPQLPFLARLAGGRDIALALGSLSAEGQAQRHWLLAALFSDAADALAGIGAGVAGYMPKRSAALVAASGVGAAALGAVALRKR